MSETARVFIAVEVPTTLELRRVRGKLATMGRAVKSVTTDGLHATLRFLGDVDRETIPIITEVLAQAVASQTPFVLRITGLNAFPRIERPSVVWAGLDDAEPLIEIAGVLDTELQSLGFAAEPKPFHPHVTLARIRSRPPEELAEMFAKHAETDFGTAGIGSIRLYESDLRPDGPRYTVLHAEELRPA